MAPQRQMVFDDEAPAQPPAAPPAQPQQGPQMVFDDQPSPQSQQGSGMVFDTPPPPPSIFNRIAKIATGVAESSLPGQEMMGVGKQATNAVAGILKIVNEHAGGAIPKSAQPDMQKAAQWLKDQGELRGWSEPGGAGEHMGAMGADYLGWEGLQALAAGAGGLAGGLGIVKNAKRAASLGDVLDNFPVLKQAAGIGLRAVNEVMNVVGPAAGTAATGYGQSYIMSGGDPEQAKLAGIISGILHLGSGQVLAPLGEYLQGLKREADAAATPQPPPLFRPEEPQPEAPAAPAPRAPAAERLAAVEQPTARAVTQASLEDLNRYRTVNESGTPTNIQQLGLPSQSVTQPYQFVVPGWSATSEAGDLLHEAGARYKQAGTRVVEGRGSSNLQPWEAQQAEPFDLPRYAETPGAVLSTQDPVTGEPTPPPSPPEPMPPAVAATPPETPTISHREPIMRPTQYTTAVRPGSDIRQATTIGGPSILTTDPEIAAGHLDQIERIVQGPHFDALPPARQADILQSRSEVMRQMQEYQSLRGQHDYSPYLHQPTFQPTDIDAALSRVGDMGDAAEEMMRGPKEMYQQWTNQTQGRPGGSFQDLNEELNDLSGKTGATNRQRLAVVQQEMQRMFNGSDPHLGRAGTNIDRAIARSQFNDGYLVKRINDGFTKAFSGAARSGELSVNQLQSNWKGIVNDEGVARMQNVLGPDRYEAMNNLINDMAGEPAGDKAAAAAADAQHQNALADWTQREQVRKEINRANKAEWDQNDAISKSVKQKWYHDVARNGWSHAANAAGMEGVAGLVPKGVLKVASAKLGAALILKHALTRPAIAQMLYQGAQLGVRPAIYGPIIGDMVRRFMPPTPAAAAEPTQPASEEDRQSPYVTSLTPDQEKDFQSWVKTNNIPFDPSPTSDYDMRGYYKDNVIGQGGVKTKVSAYDNRPHFPDTYKTPYHKTFSNESKYATADAPHWEGDRLIDKTGRVIADETPK